MSSKKGKKYKRCPICKEKDVHMESYKPIKKEKKIVMYYVECYGCGTRTADWYSKRVALEQWNRRA